MDKIILAFEFSERSNSSLEFALNIAEKTNSVLEIVWVDNTLDDLVEIEKETIHQHFEEILRNIVSQNSDRMPQGCLTYSIINGNVGEALSEKASFEEAALIVVGSHNKGKVFETRWTHTTASHLAHISKTPILSVPIDCEYNDMKTIIFPVDFNFSTRQKAPMVVWLAKMFKSFVYILGLKTATERSHIEKIKEYTYQVRSFLINNQISCEVVFRHADSLSKEILSFSAEKNADLIAVMTTQETAISNLLLGTYTHQLILQSAIPLLIVQPLNINTFGKENLGG